MAEIHTSESTIASLRGKVVVLTGGAQGIGAATVALAYRAGAHVFFGDWNHEGGQEVERSLRAEAGDHGGSVHFQKVDVREYGEQLALFDAAHKAHGCVDHAIQCAAVGEAPGNWFSPENVSIESVKEEPVILADRININLTSVLLFSRLALAYMKPTNPPPASTTAASSVPPPKSLTLVSSIAGITPAPGLFTYSPAKHGVVGLMRALRPYTPSRFGVRTNAICPWATDTAMLGALKAVWLREGLPLNTPTDVGRVILQCAADEVLNGKAAFVAGGRGFDFDEGIDRTLKEWMGEFTEEWLRGQELLGVGDGWRKPVVDKQPGGDLGEA